MWLCRWTIRPHDATRERGLGCVLCVLCAVAPLLRRAALTADAFQLDSPAGYVAVLDFGIEPDHVLLKDRLRYVGDCSTTRRNASLNPNCCRLGC